jgi:hypothetical protein
MGLMTAITQYRKAKTERDDWKRRAERAERTESELLQRIKELRDSHPDTRRLTTEQREALISALGVVKRAPVGVFSFMSNPKTSGAAEELTSAFMEAGWTITTGKGDFQPFVQDRKGRYASGIWVVGPERETVASALLSVGVENVKIDQDHSIDSTCILIVS